MKAKLFPPPGRYWNIKRLQKDILFQGKSYEGLYGNVKFETTLQWACPERTACEELRPIMNLYDLVLSIRSMASLNLGSSFANFSVPSLLSSWPPLWY